MTILIVLLSFVAVATLLISGYIAGVKRGRVVRMQLIENLRQRDEQLHRLRATNVATQQYDERTTDRVREEIETALAPFAKQGADNRKLRQELQTLARQNSDTGKLRSELHQALAPLIRREQESESLSQTVKNLLSPLLERERLGLQLATLKIGSGTRGELPQLLTTIGEKAGFASVLLSDEAGLPLASSDGTCDAEELAGVSSLLLTLTDRIRRSGSPAPNAIVVRDEANQVILHRIFHVKGERYLLTAVSRSNFLSPGALDPALTPLEGVLMREAWH